jgi:histidine kinase
MRPMDEINSVFRDGERWGLASGDHPHAAYCAAVAITHVMIRGTPLAVTRMQADDALMLLGRIGDSTNYALLRSRRRLADWLHTSSGEHSLDTPEFDETRTLQELQATSVSKSMLAHFQSLRVMHRYFDGQFAEAWRISRIVDGLLIYVPGMMTVVEHAFFQCLSAAAVWHEVPAIERAALEARLEAQLQSIDTWARNCPENFAAMHLTVCAERARVLGETGKAGELYEQAVLAARANRFLNVEAIACELAMKNGAADATRAAAWRERAIVAYEAWGAMRKADALRGGR